MKKDPMARAGFLAAALVVLGAASAFAQGTEAEREACTADAIKLCSDTIPDVPKTTACMKAHAAQLSPKCRAVIVARTDRTERVRPPGVARRGEPYGREAPPRDDDEGPDERRYEGERRYDDGPRRYEEGRRYEDERGYDGEPDYGGERRYEDPGERRYLYRGPDGDAAEAPEGRDRERARAEIDRLCEEGMIDPRTCAQTERALR